MPVTSATVQTDFLDYLLAALKTNVRLPSPLIVKKNYEATQDADNENAQSARLYEAVNSLGDFLKADVKQRGDGRCYVALEFAAGTVERFHALFKQVADGVAAVETRAASENWRDNALPTCTSMGGVVATAAGGAETELTFAEIAAQANESGDTTAFVVPAVSNGTLKIGASAETATAWAAGTNDVIDATKNAYYTLPAGAGGAVNAFTIKAMDAAGWIQSTSAVQVQLTRS